MVQVKLNRIMTGERALYLAYDQGLEHGPEGDFNDENVDPLYILDIARRGRFNAVVFGKGISELYNEEIKKSKVPLIVKLNGKTKLSKGEPISRPIGSVKEAVKLGASAVGYTIYIGSEFESEMFEDFGGIEEEAHSVGLPVILWVYPRGKGVKSDVSREMMAYAARTGLELGADIVKMKYGGNVDNLKWAVKSAGRCKVVIAGGAGKNEGEFLSMVKEVMKGGAAGLAIGRNVWQHPRPLEISREIRRIVLGRDKI